MKKRIIPFLLSPIALGASAQQSPNVILIVVDDLGYSDLAAYGHPSVRTPNIDYLGERGVRFTHAYASSPISAPSRVGILTGRCQNRFGCEFMPYDHYSKEFMKFYKSYYIPPLKKKPEGLKNFSPNIFVRRANRKTDLPDSETTIAEILKAAGYTTALIGKWNVCSDLGNCPEEHGYDYSYYFSGALTRYVDDPVDTAKYVNIRLPWAFSELPAWQKRSGPTAIREGLKEVMDTSYLTFSFANKAIDFIEKNKDNPFFLTLAFNAPHDPFQAPKAYYNRINEPDPVRRIYYAMIEALDDAVGKVFETLKQNGLFDNTLIIFTSDNGGAIYTRATDNAPLFGGKCTLFDGGLRVPFYIKFPQHILNKGQVYDYPISTLDIFSTILASANIPMPIDKIYDSKNLIPYLNGKTSEAPHYEMFWRNGYAKACLIGNWKLYMSEKDKKVFLFDLANDPNETTNLAETYPNKVKEIRAAFREWERTQTVKPLWPSSGDLIQKINGKPFYFPV